MEGAGDALHPHAQPFGGGQEPGVAQGVGIASRPGAQVHHVPVAQAVEILRRHLGAHIVVVADGVDPDAQVLRRGAADEHGGDGSVVPGQQGGSPGGGVGQQDPVHLLADEVADELLCVVVPVVRMAPAEHDLVAPGLGAGLDVQREHRVEGVGDVRQDDPQHVAAAGAQAPGQEIGPIPRLPAHPQHPLPGLRPDLRVVVQGAGDCGHRDAGKARNVPDGDASHGCLLCGQELFPVPFALRPFPAEQGIFWQKRRISTGIFIIAESAYVGYCANSTKFFAPCHAQRRIFFFSLDRPGGKMINYTHLLETFAPIAGCAAAQTVGEREGVCLS